MPSRPLLSSVVLALLAFASTARLVAQPPTCVPQLLGADRRGPAKAISRSGNTLYLGAGAAVVVVDTTDLLNPIERGYVNLDELVLDVAHWQTTVVALGETGLSFIDASDPTQPAVVGTFPFPAGWIVNSVTAREWRAYVPERNGLHVLDFSDPTAVVEIGSFPASWTSDVVLNGDRAYLLAYAVIRVLDISNPAAPVQIASVPAGEGSGSRFAIAGNGSRLATYSCSDAGHHSWCDVAFYSLSDPDLPDLRSGLEYEDWTFEGFALAWGRAYIGEGIYDLSDLSNPVYLGQLSGSGLTALAASPDSGLLFAADPYRGLLVEEVSNPTQAQVVAAVEMPGETIDGYLDGSLAITLHDRELRVLDAADPPRLDLVGILPLTDLHPSALTKVGSHVYVFSSDGLRIINLTDPTQPTVGALLSEYDRPPGQLLGDLLYLRWHGYRVSILDVSDPDDPIHVGNAPPNDGLPIVDFTAGGGFLYMWDSYDDYPTPLIRLRIYDVSDPSSPFPLSFTPMTPGHRAHSATRGRHLLLADEDRFDVIRVSDPMHPVRVSSLPLPLAVLARRRISLYGAIATVAPGEPDRYELDTQCFLIDVSDPAHPALLTAVETPGNARNAVAGPGRIFVADGPAGISIYSSCVPFADGFESGDTAEWSDVQP